MKRKTNFVEHYFKNWKWWNGCDKEQKQNLKTMAALLCLLLVGWASIWGIIQLMIEGLNLIPRDKCLELAKVYYDEGKIDGCGGAWNYFWDEKLPAILPLLLFCVGLAWILHGFGFIVVRR